MMFNIIYYIKCFVIYMNRIIISLITLFIVLLRCVFDLLIILIPIYLSIMVIKKNLL